MFKCKLCGLEVEVIPESIRVGKLYRFEADGSYHLLRKVLAPRTGPRPRKHRNPDQAPPEPLPMESTTPSTVAPPIIGRGAHNVPPAPEKTPEPAAPLTEDPGASGAA